MVSTDPISDMLTRIRNAIMVSKNEIQVPYSRMKESIARLLAESKFIDTVTVEGEGIKKNIVISINPHNANARITEIKRLSKPGRRHYVSADDIPKVKGGRGIVIISTSKGLMTGEQAKSQRIGGELICQVY